MTIETVIDMLSERIRRGVYKWNELTEEIVAAANNPITDTDDLIRLSQERKEVEVVMKELREVLELLEAYASEEA